MTITVKKTTTIQGHTFPQNAVLTVWGNGTVIFDPVQKLTLQVTPQELQKLRG